MKGGHANSGPPPDPNALRRDRDRTDWVRLPAAGRSADPPAWPLSRATARELALWDREWHRPQAIVWEANGQAEEVALYVRSLKDAEKANASTASRTLIRQQMEALGLSVPGLRRNHWIIDSEEQATNGTRGPARSATSSAKDRLKLISGGSA